MHAIVAERGKRGRPAKRGGRAAKLRAAIHHIRTFEQKRATLGQGASPIPQA
ncbi:protein of unknown function [Pararobbsia alpina]